MTIESGNQFNKELTDGEIAIRPFRLEDAEKHLAGDDEEQAKWLSGGKSTLESIQEWIRKSQEHWNQSDGLFAFAIWNNGELVGMTEANTNYESVEGLEDGDANISYGLYPQARGKGYVTRAIKLLIEFLKSKGIKRAVIRVNPDNTASISVPERLGFEKTGTITIKDGKQLIIFVKNIV